MNEKIKKQIRECFKTTEEIGFSSTQNSFLVMFNRDFSSLEEFPLREAIPIVKDLAKDFDWRVRFNVISALGFLEVVSEKSIGAIDILNDIMENDENKGLRAWAAWELKSLEEEIFIETITETKVREIIEEALKEDLNKTLKFVNAFVLTKMERGLGKGINVLDEMVRQGELTKQQKEHYSKLCLELKIEEKIEEFTQSIHRSEIELESVNRVIAQQPESKQKEKLETYVSNLKKENRELSETIKVLREAQRDLSKAHRLIIEKPRYTYEEYQKISGKKSWWIILGIQIILIVGNFFIEVFANTVNWKPWYPIGFIILLGGLFIASVFSVKGKF